MLKRIEIHNYNCFVDFNLDLAPLCLLVGSNGSGKTSLWEVLAGLQDFILRGAEISTVFPTSSLTRWRNGETVQRFALEMHIGEESFRYELEIGHDVIRKFALTRLERLTANGDKLYECIDGEVRLYGDGGTEAGVPRLSFPFNRKRSFVPDMEPRDDNRRTIAFRDAIATMWLLAPAPQYLNPTTSADAPWLDRYGKNFASWFRGILADRPEIINPLLADLRPAMPGLQRVGFKSISAEVRELMLAFKASGNEYQLSIGELSDGQRNLLLLHGFLHGALTRRAIAFIDEPEVCLALHEMQPWISAMAQAIENNGGQALVISHHPEVINYVAAAHTVQFRRPRGEAVVTQEVTLETTGGMRVSEWLSQPWIYEDEDEKPIQ